MKENIYIISWDECVCETNFQHMDDNGQPFTLPINCTDDELVAKIREINGDEEKNDADFDGWGQDWQGRPNQYGWNCVDVVRGKNTAVIEWRSDRNHLATTTVMWF